jgi:hypothetical protein
MMYDKWGGGNTIDTHTGYAVFKSTLVHYAYKNALN